MTLQAWLDGRVPAPPADLRDHLSRELGVPGDESSTQRTRALADAAEHALDRARGRPGRVRDSAFELLAADALITYACESALEEENPEAVLAKLLRIARLR